MNSGKAFIDTNVLLYLASDASAAITGSSFTLDDGQSL